MEKYFAFLRGINVSGSNIIRMEDLRKVMSESGFQDVRTYIQSGNVLFSYPSTPEKSLGAMISNLISAHFGLEVPVIVKSFPGLGLALDENPFSNNINYSEEFCHITFLDSVPGASALLNLQQKDSGDEHMIVINDRIYLYLPYGYGRTKLNNTFFENKLKMSATTRNWRTLRKLISMAAD